MSKKVELEMDCPRCKTAFKAMLYRTIWIEYPDNMKLIMTDSINVAHCPSCGLSERQPFPFLATNARKKVAVWYEPIPDQNIDSDVELYRKHYGDNYFLATAERIKSWSEFKRRLNDLNKRPDVNPTFEEFDRLKQGMRSGYAEIAESQQRPATPSPFASLKAWAGKLGKAYISFRLSRQAVKMGWVAAGFITTGGDRNKKLSRDWLIAAVWHRDGKVGLLAPEAPHRFDDFVQIERWIAEDNRRSGDESSSPEIRYMANVEDFIRSTGNYENIVLPAQTVLEFMEALAKVYKAGFQTNTSPKVIGLLAVDGARLYGQQPEKGVGFLERVAGNLNAKLQ